jgi:putative hemolysin
MLTIEIITIVLLTIANGAFALSEIAVVSARKARLQDLSEEGDRNARIALQLANSPNDFLSVVRGSPLTASRLPLGLSLS